MNKTQKISNVTDIFLYYNGKNYIYCPPFSKTGYILTDMDAKEFSIYSTRFFVPLSCGILVYYFSAKPLISILAGIILFVVMEASFFKKFLKKLPTIDNFDKKSAQSIFDIILNKVDVKQMLVPLALCIALTILIPINAIKNYAGYILTINYVCAAITALIALFFLICIIKALKKK